VDENLRRVRGLHQEVQAGVSELQLPVVDFDHLQNLLDSVNQENTAQVVDLVDGMWSCVALHYSSHSSFALTFLSFLSILPAA
jgi:hypothetical protein